MKRKPHCCLQEQMITTRQSGYIWEGLSQKMHEKDLLVIDRSKVLDLLNEGNQNTPQHSTLSDEQQENLGKSVNINQPRSNPR